MKTFLTSCLLLSILKNSQKSPMKIPKIAERTTTMEYGLNVSLPVDIFAQTIWRRSWFLFLEPWLWSCTEVAGCRRFWSREELHTLAYFHLSRVTFNQISDCCSSLRIRGRLLSNFLPQCLFLQYFFPNILGSEGTIGVDFKIKTMVVDGITIKMHLWVRSCLSICSYF